MIQEIKRSLNHVFECNVGEVMYLKVKYEKTPHTGKKAVSKQISLLNYLGHSSRSAGRKPHTNKSWINFPTSCYLTSATTHICPAHSKLPRGHLSPRGLGLQWEQLTKLGSLWVWPRYSSLRYTETKAGQESNASRRGLIMPCSTYNF